MRWGALALGLVLVAVAHDGLRAAAAGACLLAYTLWRSIRPIGIDRTGTNLNSALLLEVAIGVAVVEATGFGRSPFLACLGVAAGVAGFAGGVRVVVGLAAMAGLAVVLPTVVLASYRPVAATSAQFAVELVLVAVVGGLSRYLIDDSRPDDDSRQEAIVRQERAEAQARHLSDVNDMLAGVHSATMHEPTPLDLDGVARWAIECLEEIFAPDVCAVVLRDPVTSGWRLAAGTGTNPSGPGGGIELPDAVALAAEGVEPLACDGLQQGLNYKSRWGLYCPMRARGELVGVLVVESFATRRTSPDDRDQIGELGRTVALAIDNARWLDRIHTLGAVEERSRLARELHDHVGQSVVYLGFEVDRLIQDNEGRAVRDDLVALRGDLRELVGDLRDALVDLRSDVSDTNGVDRVLESFVERVNARNNVKVTLVTEPATRLPLSVEREFVRVAREAVTNAERHARASSISVLWRCREDGALLEVSDDGTGMPATFARRGSAYGLLGMRERADSVRATLEISSRRGKGTRVRMYKAVT
ncbi:MAG TPA: GAF domain-containing sensor histidine kinase [Acidimicrobiales bacterium]|nr:GAF domain-containing sensor histidine kinase [Acidimicrobiales bacterium]